jgi:hypothetical protein
MKCPKILNKWLDVKPQILCKAQTTQTFKIEKKESYSSQCEINKERERGFFLFTQNFIVKPSPQSFKVIDFVA